MTGYKNLHDLRDMVVSSIFNPLKTRTANKNNHQNYVHQKYWLLK